MKLLLISDGRPGHANLSEGIAAAIARQRSVTIDRIGVERGRWPGPIAALSTRSVLSDERILSMIYGIDPKVLRAADIVISSGAETLAANICIARLLRAQNVFYGSLRQYRASDFTLVLTSYRQSVKASNIVQALKPSALDPDLLPLIEVGRQPRRLGLLVGGPTSGIAYSQRDWQNLCDLVEAVGHQFNVRWIVSNSRRTPAEATAMLRKYAADGGVIEQFIDIDEPGRATLYDLFREVDGVICTADSSSMVSETIWARRPVLAVAPNTFKLTRNELQYRNWLSQNGWYAAAKMAALTAERLIGQLSDIQPLDENPLDRFAKLLTQHLKLSAIAE